MRLEKVKHILMRRIWRIPVYLIIALLGASLATGAIMYTLRIPSTITILPPQEGTYEIKIYEDEACNTEITSFDFGSVALGGNLSVHFFVKSFSTVPIAVRATIEPYTPGLHHIIWIVHENDPLQPSEVREVTFTLLVDVSATDGTYSFDLLLNVYPA